MKKRQINFGRPFGTYVALSAEEVGQERCVDVVGEAARALVVAPAVDKELVARVLVDEGADERPEDGEDAWGAHDQQAPHRLGVVRLDHLDDVQQRLDARPPQVTHAEALQVDDARAVTAPTTTALVTKA